MPQRFYATKYGGVRIQHELICIWAINVPEQTRSIVLGPHMIEISDVAAFPAKLQRPMAFEAPESHLRHFVSLDVRREGQMLQVQSAEVIAPMPTRGGKGRAGGSRRPADRSRSARNG